MRDAYLILETGEILKGQNFGAEGTGVGELVFTTAMTGCAESLTDPSYCGQIAIYTFPMLGNYGIAWEDRESPRCRMRGVVVREFCDAPSNFRCEVDVDAFLKENGVVGVSGVDTRTLTQRIRDHGVLNACVTTDDPSKVDLEALKNYRVTNSVEETSGREKTVLPAVGEKKFRVALLDYGAKSNIARCLSARGCEVTTLPFDTRAEDISSGGYDGVMLSNGPGDPADNAFSIAQLEKLLGKTPIFGICLGHQMLAIAAGGATRKMKFGHRGANQPVRDLVTGRVYVTSQNHGYAVDAESLTETGGRLRYVNVNDGTCEGVDYPDKNAFSTQFHPESHGGPRDCEGIFDRFIRMMADKKAEKQA